MNLRIVGRHCFARLSTAEWTDLIARVPWLDYAAWLEERESRCAEPLARAFASPTEATSIAMLGVQQPGGLGGAVTFRVEAYAFQELVEQYDWSAVGARARAAGHVRFGVMCRQFDRMRPLSYIGRQILQFLRSGQKAGPQPDLGEAVTETGR